MNFNLDLCDDINEEIEEAILRPWRNKKLIQSDELQAFEQEFAAYCGRNHCVGVGSGTDALALTLRAWGIGPGDEVITPAFNVAYTAMAVEMVGATNVLVDVGSNGLMDPEKLYYAMNGNTKAVIPVHLYGQKCDMKRIREIVNLKETKVAIRILEDAAQAHGVFLEPWLSDAVAYSFYPTKNLGGMGEGGGVVTNDEALATTLRWLRDGGRIGRYTHAIPGVNSMLDDLNAAVLRVKLRHLDSRNKMRRNLARKYMTALPNRAFFGNHLESVFHLMVAHAFDSSTREEEMRKLKSAGIPTLIHYPVPVHRQPAFKSLNHLRFPLAEALSATVYSLPMYPTMPEYVIEKVATVLGGTNG